MIEIEKYETFFAEYQAFEAKHWVDRFKAEKKEVLNLAVGFRNLEQRLNKIVLEESPQYNIFSILNVRHYETKLHTPFLVNLLNPKGSHGQGSLFLDLFFEKVLRLDYRFENIKNFSIKEEHRTADGRIDIMMYFHDGKNWIGIVIENKIYAEDQKNQLKRYHDFLKNQFKSVKNRKLYYLTPRKVPPTTHSISEEDAEELRKQRVLHHIGYHQDIRPWLEKSLSNIQSPIVKYTIEQYLKIIITL